MNGTTIKEVPSSIVLKNLRKLNIRGWKGTLYSFYSKPARHVPMGLLLSCLSGLHSLTYMDLFDCNILSIPNDIGCLSSLVRLDLSGNNFVSLLERISQLSYLQTLYLEGCKRLQSLENVPSTIDFVFANNCTSLERLSKLQNDPFGSYHWNFCFQCLNSFKSVDNVQSCNNMLQVSLSLSLSLSLSQVLNIMLCVFQKQSPKLPDMLEILFLGSEIPKWFSQESLGDKLNVQVPSRGYNELMGITFCVVFVPNECHQCPIYWDFSCSFKVDGSQFEETLVESSISTKYGKVESHHCWLLYLSNHNEVTCCHSNWQKIFSPID